jgi:hypothetical protein
MRLALVIAERLTISIELEEQTGRVRRIRIPCADVGEGSRLMLPDEWYEF